MHQPPTPFKHQAEDFTQAKDMPGYARFWEQGTGKTRPTIDEQVYHMEKGNINAVLVLAPNGVHSNWAKWEWPLHVRGDLHEHVRFFEFDGYRVGTKSYDKQINDLLRGSRIPFVSMSYDSLMTNGGLTLAQHLLKRRKCFLVADEAHRIKDPSTKRTKRVLAASKWAPYRRALTGTPILESPMNAYSIMKFVDENYWLPYRLSTYTTFRAMFGIYGKGFASPEQKKRMAARGEMDLSNLVGYQHMDLLADALSSHSSRLLKEDVLDLPPKLYTQYSHALTPTQQRMFDELRENLIAELEGGTITSKLALTELLRLQQITCGHVNMDDGSTKLFDPNPRLKLMSEIQMDIPHRHIIFCRFTQDVDMCMEMSKKNGLRPVRYDGSTGTQERNEAVERFQDLPVDDPKAYDVIVANTAALSEGRTLTAAKTVNYFSNGWSAIQRQQSEDRAHRLGQDGAPLPGLNGGHGVQYNDIICPGTPDEKIVKAYRTKQSISEQVLGDNPRDWI